MVCCGKACGNRREAVCAPCAERYRRDAYHLIAAGLRGGKGVPENGGRTSGRLRDPRPPLSFGVVHAHVLGPDGQPLRCHPRRDRPVCEHGHADQLQPDSRAGRPVPG